MAQRDPRWVDPLAAYHGTHDALSAQQLEQAKKVFLLASPFRCCCSPLF